MRLLYFINSISNCGGIERIVIDKMNYLASLPGFEVAVSYYGTGSSVPFFPLDGRVRRVPLGSDAYAMSFCQKLAYSFRLFGIVKRVIDDVRPDVVINANTVVLGWMLPFIRTSVPKVVELHFSWQGMNIIGDQKYGRHSLRGWFNNFLRRSIYCRYDRCVVLTNADMRHWRFGNIVVIPNFTNFVPAQRSAARSHTIAAVGRLSPPKNFRLLIDAWQIVSHKLPHWSLRIWGSGELQDELRDQVSSLGLEGSCHLMGRTDNVAGVYASADFFVLSSLFEGHVLVVLEALKAGLPCVCTCVGGADEMVRDGYNGFLAREMTPQCLASALLRMAAIDGPDYDAMCGHAREAAEAYNKSDIMDRWVALFDSLTTKAS